MRTGLLLKRLMKDINYITPVLNANQNVIKEEKMNTKQIYKKAIERWGEELQVGMLSEEIGELLIAVNKYRREATQKNRDNVCEELADVQIMMEQIEVLFKLDSHRIHEWYEMKLKKLESFLTPSGKVTTDNL